MDHLFVYGTLMRGDQNHEAYLKNETFINKGVLMDYGLYELGEYPGIVEKSGGAVKGEVYQVSEDALQRVDEYEDEGILYQKREVLIHLEDQSQVRAWTYVYLMEVEESNDIPYEQQPWKQKVEGR